MKCSVFFYRVYGVDGSCGDEAVRFATGRVTRFVRNAIRKGRGTTIRAFTGVRRNVPKTVSFLSGPGCARCVCSAGSDVMLISHRLRLRGRIRAALVHMSGTCRTMTGLLTLCRDVGPQGGNVSTLSCITSSTRVNRSYCVTPFTCVKRGIHVNGKARVCPRAAICSGTSINRSYVLCSGISVCRSYGVNGEIVLRSKDIVNTSNFNFTPANGNCSGVPRVNVIAVRSSIRVNTGAYMSHSAVNSACVQGNIGLSGVIRVTRGIRMKRGAIVSTRINMTNSAGVKR